jgi:hypothetical protein
MQEYFWKAHQAEPPPLRRWVEYHSREWQVLLEMGWMTWSVDDGQVEMIHCTHGGSCRCIYVG